jgi:hypothetical protein
MERAYFVTVDGADYRLAEDSLPVYDHNRGVYTIKVIRPSTGETPAYSLSRHGPYSFKSR